MYSFAYQVPESKDQQRPKEDHMKEGTKDKYF